MSPSLCVSMLDISGVDVGMRWAYKRGPFGGFRIVGACCLRLWRRGKGCADGGRTGVKLVGLPDVRAFMRTFGGPYYWVRPRGWAWDELESLILAQNERWRHA